MMFMTFMFSSHVLTKVLACSLMLRLSQVWFASYLAVDTSMYFCYKIFRGEMRYWLSIKGLPGWVLSVFVRIIVKSITDFTLIVQFRRKYFRRNVERNRKKQGLSSFIHISSILTLLPHSLSLLTISLCRSVRAGWGLLVDKRSSQPSLLPCQCLFVSGVRGE